MPQLSLKVDNTSGNYESLFLYTLNASFNGISGDIDSAQIRIFVPETLSIILGDVEEPIKEVRLEEEQGVGTTYIFDFGQITDLGIAVRIGFGAQFTLDAESLDEIRLVAELWVNEEAMMSTASDTIQLVVTPRFEINRELVLPAIGPAPGGAVFYKVTLENFGDLGAKITNVVITCEGADFTQLDEDFDIIGMDESDQYADTTQDDKRGYIEDNNAIFELDEYRGQRYVFYYRGVIDSTALVGAEVDTTTTWTIDGVEQIADIFALTLKVASSDIYVFLYGPDYTLSDRLLCFEIYMQNTGNQIISDISFSVDLPEEINYYSFSSGTFWLSAIEQDIDADYEITYTTINGNTGTFGTFNTLIDTEINIADYIEVGDNLSTISWNLAQIGIGVKEKSTPHIKGIVQSDLTIGMVLIGSFTALWQEGTTTMDRVNTNSTVIQDICVLDPIFSQSVGGDPIRPKEVITYTIGADGYQSRLNNPTFVVLLPKELEYSGNATLYVSRHFEETTEAQLPPVEIVEDFNANGDTLIKFDFRDEYAFEFSQKAIVKITFDATVLDTATGTISTTGLLNLSSSVGEIAQGVSFYRDQDGISDDPAVSKYYARSSSVSNLILLFLSISGQKLVKGLLDEDYIGASLIGSSIEGGSVNYKIEITNTGNATIDEIEIVDILPHLDDTGVIEEFTARGSEFTIYNIAEVVAMISTREEPIETTIMYTQSYDPVRFGNNFDIIGTVDDWSEIPPEDITTVCGFKVGIKESILPKEVLTIEVSCTIPVGVSEELVAWNSFAADVVYTNMVGVQEHLLAIEPEKVGVEIIANDPTLATITGFVWRDTNKDGEPEIDEVGINDIGVLLYDESGTPLRATFTTDDVEGTAGYYSFGNLDPGNYYIRFYVDTIQDTFSPQRLDIENGSKPVPESGITGQLTLVAGETLMVNAGVVQRDGTQIETILAVNKSANSMMRSVIYNQMLLSLKYEDTIELIE